MNSNESIAGGVNVKTYTPAGVLISDTNLAATSRTASVIKPDPARRKKPSGWIAPLAYSADYSRHVRGYGVLRSVNAASGNIEVRTGNLVEIADSPLYSSERKSITPAMRDRAVTKALLKLKDQKFNAGVALAEAGRTADLLGSNLTRLARAALLLKKGRFREARRALGIRKGSDAPAKWLELQYGWKPLLSDIHGAVEATQDAARSGKAYITVKAVESLEHKWDYFLNPTIGKDRYIYRGTCSSSVFVRLDYEPDNYLLSAFMSLGLTNPLEIAWELVPFSFVVDWALPIGNWLSTLDAALGFKFKGGSRSERIRYVGRMKRVPIDIPGNTWRYPSYDGSECYRRNTNLVRTVYSSSPLPSLPRIKSPLNLTRAANGLSLLTQVFGSRR